MNSHDYGLKITTGPAAAVVATSDAKLWMRVTHSDEDAVIARFDALPPRHATAWRRAALTLTLTKTPGQALTGFGVGDP